MSNYKYIEIRKWDDLVVRRIDVSGKSDRAIEKAEDGIAINLNHDLFYVEVKEYDTKQTLEP